MRRFPIIVLLLAGISSLSTATLSAEPAAGMQARAEPTRFGWPFAGGHEVSRPFQPPGRPFGPGHRGVDLAGEPGQPVLAAAGGLVVFAGRLAGRNVVSVEHPGGLRTTYEPVAPAVTPGQQVARGQPLGQLEPGHPGCTAASPKVCLHWGARRRLDYLDPLRLLGGHVRLLPWDAPPSRP